MPIYAYKCDSCGFAKDVLQKISDAPLSECPSCQASAFRKQVTAAGFQLKGSGWYVTDFRGGDKGAGAKSDDKSAQSDGGKSDGGKSDTGADAKPSGSSEAKADSKPAAKSESKAESKPAAAPAAKKPASSTPSGSGSGS